VFLVSSTFLTSTFRSHEYREFVTLTNIGASMSKRIYPYLKRAVGLNRNAVR